jgi:hypothetical protein
LSEIQKNNANDINENEDKKLNRVILILTSILLLFVIIYSAITYIHNKNNEKEKQHPLLNDQSGWVENYVYLYGVDYNESKEQLYFKIENRSKTLIKNIEQVKIKLTPEKGKSEEYTFEKKLDLEPFGDISFNKPYDLTENQKYQIEVFVTYNGKEYSTGKSNFYVDKK